MNDRGALHRFCQSARSAMHLLRRCVCSAARRDGCDGSDREFSRKPLQESRIHRHRVSGEVAEREAHRLHAGESVPRNDALFGVDALGGHDDVADRKSACRQGACDADADDGLEAPCRLRAAHERFGRRGGGVGAADAADDDSRIFDDADRLRLRFNGRHNQQAHGSSL